jgi:ABC-type phosphate transport system permease subunit
MRIRVYAPAIVIAILLLAMFAVTSAFAAGSTPEDVTKQACDFGTKTYDWGSRILFGMSIVFLLIGLLMAVRNMHSEGPMAPVLALFGVSILFAFIGFLPSIAPVALAASGGPACP